MSSPQSRSYTLSELAQALGVDEREALTRIGLENAAAKLGCRIVRRRGDDGREAFPMPAAGSALPRLPVDVEGAERFPFLAQRPLQKGKRRCRWNSMQSALAQTLPEA